MTEAHESDLKRHLTDEHIHVTQGTGTERAFTGKYVDPEDDGAYVSVCCGTGLFSSDQEYDSASGWPSFWLPLAGERVRNAKDSSHGMAREEVVCANCGAHLSHAFGDGPHQPTGRRCFINFASFDFRTSGDVNQ